jgi:hypothetical protein
VNENRKKRSDERVPRDRTKGKKKKARTGKARMADASPPDCKAPVREYWARVKAGREARRPSVSAHRVTVDSFKSDPVFPRIERAVAAILVNGKVVTPIAVLIHMKLLTAEDVENWRFGRVPYLERVIRCNLTKLGRMLRILRMHAHDLNLVPSQTVYVRWGKRGRRAPLRFSKTGDPRIEEAYGRHFLWPGKGPFHPPREKPLPQSAMPGGSIRTR